MLPIGSPQVESLKCQMCGDPAKYRVLTPRGYADYGACEKHNATLARSAYESWVVQRVSAQDDANKLCRMAVESWAMAIAGIERAKAFPVVPHVTTEAIDG